MRSAAAQSRIRSAHHHQCTRMPRISWRGSCCSFSHRGCTTFRARTAAALAVEQRQLDQVAWMPRWMVEPMAMVVDCAQQPVVGLAVETPSLSEPRVEVVTPLLASWLQIQICTHLAPRYTSDSTHPKYTAGMFSRLARYWRRMPPRNLFDRAWRGPNTTWAGQMRECWCVQAATCMCARASPHTRQPA